jgi:hypothetical protein
MLFYKLHCLVGCDAVQAGRSILVAERNLLPPFSIYLNNLNAQKECIYGDCKLRQGCA